jgi:hypothetical protein
MATRFDDYRKLYLSSRGEADKFGGTWVDSNKPITKTSQANTADDNRVHRGRVN